MTKSIGVFSPPEVIELCGIAPCYTIKFEDGVLPDAEVYQAYCGIIICYYCVV